MGVFLANLNKVVKLGRIARPPKHRVEILGHFLRGPLPTPPGTLDLTPKVPTWPMYGNDQVGDCVFASIGHQIGCWSANELGAEKLYGESEVVGWYSAVTGYNPSQPWSDQGAVITDALDYWIRNGYSGNKLAGYVGAKVSDLSMMQFAAWVFGGLKLGILMPAAWQNTTGPGKVWDVGPNQRGQWSPGSWGGHDVPVVGYTSQGVTVITWGAKQLISWRALATYCDEAWACASWDWCSDNDTPTGILKADLIAYFGTLGGGPIVPPPSPPSPPPPPTPGNGVIVIDPNQRAITYPPGWSASGSSTTTRAAH